MAVNRPTTETWNDSGSASVDPPAAKKTAGFSYKERPAYQFINWLFKTLFSWINFFDGTINQFAPSEQAIPDMTISIKAGKIFTGGVHISVAAQNTAVITAPVTNPRIDRVAINTATGAVVVIQGTEAATPVAPGYSINHYPICQVALATTTTTITNSLLTDERVSVPDKGPVIAGYSAGSTEYVAQQLDTYNIYNLAVNQVNGVWESVGPTGSGAANIWTALDSLPANTKWIRIRTYINTSKAASTLISAIVYAKKYGDGSSATFNQVIAQATAYSYTADTLLTRENALGYVLLDSNKMFDMKWVADDTAPTIQCVMDGFGL